MCVFKASKREIGLEASHRDACLVARLDRKQLAKLTYNSIAHSVDDDHDDNDTIKWGW